MNDEFSSGGDAAGVQDSTSADGRHEEPIQAPRPVPQESPSRLDVPQTAGGLIRAAREAQGIDLASLAAMLKIPLRKLEALEEGRHADMPGATFERALAQAACRVLKIDSKAVLAQLPQLGGNTLEQMGGGINAPFRERQGRGEGADAGAFLRPIVLLPVLLAAAALALFYLPAEFLSHLPRLNLGGGEGASAPVASASDGTSTTTVALAQPGPDAASATAPGAAPPAPASAVAPGASQATVPAPATAAAVDEVLAHPSAEPSIPVQVTAGESSWIEVVDAQGHTLLSRTVMPGESVGLDGLLPMKVKVGNARATRLTLRGENVDLGPYTRDNVARLDLK